MIGSKQIIANEICLILHIIRKPNPIIVLLFIQNVLTSPGIFQSDYFLIVTEVVSALNRVRLEHL